MDKARPLGEILADLTRESEERSAYRADPEGYLSSVGYEGLSPEEAGEAVTHFADRLPPEMAEQLAPVVMAHSPATVALTDETSDSQESLDDIGGRSILSDPLGTLADLPLMEDPDVDPEEIFEDDLDDPAPSTDPSDAHHDLDSAHPGEPDEADDDPEDTLDEHPDRGGDDPEDTLDEHPDRGGEDLEDTLDDHPDRADDHTEDGFTPESIHESDVEDGGIDPDDTDPVGRTPGEPELDTDFAHGNETDDLNQGDHEILHNIDNIDIVEHVDLLDGGTTLGDPSGTDYLSAPDEAAAVAVGPDDLSPPPEVAGIDDMDDIDDIAGIDNMADIDEITDIDEMDEIDEMADMGEVAELPDPDDIVDLD